MNFPEHSSFLQEKLNIHPELVPGRYQELPMDFATQQPLEEKPLKHSKVWHPVTIFYFSYAPFRGNIRSLLQMLRRLRGVSFYCDCIAHCAFWLDTDGDPHGWSWGRRFTARHPLPFRVPFPTADKRYVNDVFHQMSPCGITGGLNHVPIVGLKEFWPTIGRADFQQRLWILDQLCGFSAGCVDF